MLAWVSITPLGRPVVPEEYITRQTSSGLDLGVATERLGGGEQRLVLVALGAVGGDLDDVLDVGAAGPGSCSTSGISSEPTSSTLAPESLTA